jgi:hypothetical protein
LGCFDGNPIRYGGGKQQIIAWWNNIGLANNIAPVVDDN